MNFDKPPDFWTMVIIGAVAFVLLLCLCCASVPLLFVMQQPGGMVPHR
jgi:hypothetical protein